MKSLDSCQCQGDEITFINSSIFSRDYYEKPYDMFYKKGRNRKNKGNYHHDHHGGRNSHYNKRGRYGNHGGRYNDHPHHHENRKSDEHQIIRNPISENVKEMKDKADKWKGIIESEDKGDIEKRTKALLNKITPDNMKRLKPEVLDVFLCCHNNEDRKKFIKVVFRKATFEDKYVSMYANLIKYLGEHEYDAMNTETPTSSKVNKAKESQLKRDVVDECRI